MCRAFCFLQFTEPRHLLGLFRYEGFEMSEKAKCAPSLSQPAALDVILKSANGKVEMNLSTGEFKLVR